MNFLKKFRFSEIALIYIVQNITKVASLEADSDDMENRSKFKGIHMFEDLLQSDRGKHLEMLLLSNF